MPNFPSISSILSVENLPDLEGKKVLLRTDFNIPLKDGELQDTFRVDAVLPTLKLLLSRHAKVFVLSHTDQGSLRRAAEYLGEQVPTALFQALEEVSFRDTPVALVENLRLSPLEEANDPNFAKHLASFADYYVNEAFSVSHRFHASIVGVPAHLPAYAGLRFLEEIKELSRFFSPEHPFLFILGGAKVKTKEPTIKKFLERADGVFVGGVLANDFLRAKGYEVGISALSDVPVDMSLVDHPRILLPVDVVVAGARAGKVVRAVSEVSLEERILDMGPRTLDLLRARVAESRALLWSGPLGLYEEGYSEGSLALSQAIARSNAYSVLGGGDTLALVGKGTRDKFSFVSTAGGAMLQFLAEETLPGLEALLKSKNPALIL